MDNINKQIDPEVSTFYVDENILEGHSMEHLCCFTATMSEVIK